MNLVINPVQHEIPSDGLVSSIKYLLDSPGFLCFIRFELFHCLAEFNKVNCVEGSGNEKCTIHHSN